MLKTTLIINSHIVSYTLLMVLFSTEGLSIGNLIKLNKSVNTNL